MVSSNYHNFFLGAASVAGALVGLLFVAMSVMRDGAERIHGQRLRASAAFTAFTNSLTISLFALIPTDNLGWAAIVVGAIGMTFVGGALLSLIRVYGLRAARAWLDASFLVGLGVVFVVQLVSGITLTRHGVHAGALNRVSTLVVVCFLIGIARTWELMGGPHVGLAREVGRLVRSRGDDEAPAAQDGVSRSDESPSER